MKKTKKDKFQDVALTIIKPLVYVWMFLDAKRTVKKTDEVDFNRKEPYIMLANHTFLFDVVHVPLRFKVVPYIVASQTLFTKQPTKFLLTNIAHVIPKSKGKSDLRTSRQLIGSIKRGYPILIFPEGNTTFYGNTGYIEDSTMKLIKKLKVDVITCNVKGGYLSKPRWATGKRKNRKVEFNYEIAIKKDKLKDLTIEEISEIINTKLYNNDYEYLSKNMIKRPGKKLAEGLENVLYICPNCESVNTLVTKNNEISCSHCNTKGHMDEYGLIHGFKYNNPIDWDKWQRTLKEKLYNSVINSSGVLFTIRFSDESEELIGKVTIDYENGEFTIKGAHNFTAKLDEITNPVMTLSRDFSFTFNDIYYYIKLDKFGASLLRVSQNKY